MCVPHSDDDGKVVQQRRKIAAHYAKGWFVIDLATSLPYEQLVQIDQLGVSSIIAMLKVCCKF